MNNNTKGRDPHPSAQYMRKRLVQVLNELEQGSTIQPRILNIGAGQKIHIEQYLTDMKADYTCDRIDVVDCSADLPSVGECWQSSVESMSPVISNRYNAAFANWVLEHVPDLHRASREIFRILKPGSMFITTIPNVTAPEFLLARITPLWFHQLIRGQSHAYETHYAFKSIQQLCKIFESAGFRTGEIKYFPCVESYLRRISPMLGKLGKAYDKFTAALNLNGLMGAVCIIFEKTP